MLLSRRLSNAAGQNATLHKNVCVMSSSQLLTITETHGFRALLATAVWIIGRVAQLWRGLRNLSCGNRQPARMDVGSGSWLRILISEVAVARSEPVLWFDIMGRRDGPIGRALRHRHVLLYGSPFYSLAPALAQQVAPRRQ
jgi:hypothetical protein